MQTPPFLAEQLQHVRITKKTGQYYSWLWSKMVFVSLFICLSPLLKNWSSWTQAGSDLHVLIDPNVVTLTCNRKLSCQYCLQTHDDEKVSVKQRAALNNMRKILINTFSGGGRGDNFYDSAMKAVIFAENECNSTLNSSIQLFVVANCNGGTTGWGNITKIWNGTNEWFPARKPSQHLLY